MSWYKKPEMIVAFSALFLSIITTVVSIYSAYVDRSYARASFWPRVELFRSFGNDKFSYGITNSGNGPALIKYAKVQYKSAPIQRWRSIPNLPNFTQSHFGTRILSSQNHITPVLYKGPEVTKFLSADEFVDIEICYCSIYEECWITDRRNDPKPINSCSIKEQERFLQ